jgi:ribonucleoside-triphosphate reductase (thioredoxin)
LDAYQQYIHKSRYARYLPSEERRETWKETVTRYIKYWGDKLNDDERVELFKAIHDLEVMPSMRALMTAGEALDRDNMAGFNCSYIAIDSPRCFDEMMYVLMCGTGVGYSVEDQYVSKLPEIAEDFHATDTVIHVPDSKIGWAKSYRELVSLLYSGQIPEWDTSRVRPAGASLKTFGGRASGPEPLIDLFKFTVRLFKSAAGRRLTSLECHDLCCKIAQIVVVGGVRRSALISLSDLSDDALRQAKHGAWYNTESQRGLANNSACYNSKPSFEQFLDEWRSLYESKSGERGIFSRAASQKQAERNGRRDSDRDFGTNPCSEIILRKSQVCNLSEVVVRPEDTAESLRRKVRIATILGTLQATLTDFRYLRGIWKANTEEESLLGVSLTGILDNPLMTLENDDLDLLLEGLRDVAIETNKEWAEKLGIPQSAAITCVKPSGTVSQMVDSASGIHGRYAPFYIRRVRADMRDPLCAVLEDAGVPCEMDNFSPTTKVFSFPKKAPEAAVFASEQSGMEQLELWAKYQEHWCEHKPSITVYYRDSEFLEIGNWVYNNFDTISGISFLPYDEHSYAQAPYEQITEDEYAEMVKDFPTEFDWNLNEADDFTEGAQTLACVGGACEL